MIATMAWVKGKNTPASDAQTLIPHIVITEDGWRVEIMARDPIDAINRVNAGEEGVEKVRINSLEKEVVNKK